ncbi:hypothetical protein D9M68_617890 [compost metagenome]
MALVARSNTSGSPPLRGAAKAMGLVPNRALWPPWGTTQVMLLTKLRATSPSRAKGSTSGQSAAKWWELRIASSAMPLFRTFSITS